MPLGGLSYATVVFEEQHLDQEVRAVRSASPTAVTLKQGPQIEFLIDQAVDLARPVVGIELAVKSLPVGRFGRPGGFQKTTEERLSVVVDFSTISIRSDLLSDLRKKKHRGECQFFPNGGRSLSYNPSILPIRRNLSTKGGYRGVPGRGDPAGLGRKITPPTPFARGDEFAI